MVGNYFKLYSLSLHLSVYTENYVHPVQNASGLVHQTSALKLMFKPPLRHDLKDRLRMGERRQFSQSANITILRYRNDSGGW